MCEDEDVVYPTGWLVDAKIEAFVASHGIVVDAVHLNGCWYHPTHHGMVDVYECYKHNCLLDIWDLKGICLSGDLGGGETGYIWVVTLEEAEAHLASQGYIQGS